MSPIFRKSGGLADGYPSCPSPTARAIAIALVFALCGPVWLGAILLIMGAGR